MDFISSYVRRSGFLPKYLQTTYVHYIPTLSCIFSHSCKILFTIGSTITTLAATDDENDPITFSLDDIGKQILSVVPSNGSLILKEKLDREVRN